MFNMFMTSPRKRSDAAQSPRPPMRAHEPFYKSLLENMDLLQRLTGASFSNFANTNFVNSIILEIRRDIDNAVSMPNVQPFSVYKLAQLLTLIDEQNVLDNSRDIVVNIYNHIINDLFCAEQCHFIYQLSCDLVITLLRDRLPPWQGANLENAAKLVWRLLFGLDDKSGVTFLNEHHEVITCLQSQEWFQDYVALPYDMQLFCKNVLNCPWTFALLTPIQLNGMFLPPPDEQWDHQTIMMHGESIVKCLMTNLKYSQRLLNEAAIQQSSVMQMFLKYPQLIETLNSKALVSLFVLADAQEGFRASTAFCFMLRQLTQCVIKGDLDNITAVSYLLYEMAVYGYLYSPEMPYKALLNICGANDLLETLQFLDPSDQSHTRPEQFIFVDSGKESRPSTVPHKSGSDFEKFNELLLSDETLILRQAWAKQPQYQQLFRQYPYLLKGVSSDDVKILPLDTLRIMAERAMLYRKIYNIFLSPHLLMAYLNIESLATLYYQDEIIKTYINEIKLPIEIIQVFIENTCMDALIERVTAFAHYLKPNYLKDLLSLQASRQLLLAFLSNKCTRQAFMRYPILLQCFAKQDLSNVAESSSFLRQCIKQRDLLDWIKKNYDVLGRSSIIDKILASLYYSEESVAAVKLFYPDCAHPASKLCLSHLNYDISIDVIAMCVRSVPVRSHQFVVSQGITASEKQNLLPIFEKIIIPYGSLQILEIYILCLNQALMGQETVSRLLPSYFIAAQVLLMFETAKLGRQMAFNKSLVKSKLLQWAKLVVDYSRSVEQLFNTYRNECTSNLAYLVLDTLYRTNISIESIIGVNFDLLCASREVKLPLLALIENLFGIERKQKLIQSIIDVPVAERIQVADKSYHEEAYKPTDEEEIIQAALIAEFGEVFEKHSGSNVNFKVTDLSLPKTSYKRALRQNANTSRVPHSVSTTNLRGLVKESLLRSSGRDKVNKHKSVKDKKPKTQNETAASSPANNQSTSSENIAATRARIFEKWEAQKSRLEAMKNKKQVSQMQQIAAQQTNDTSTSVQELPGTNMSLKRERRNTVSGDSLASIAADATLKAEQDRLRNQIDERKQKLDKMKSLSLSATAARADTPDAIKIQAREERLRELEREFLSQSQLRAHRSMSASEITTTRPRRNTMTNVTEKLIVRQQAIQQTAPLASDLSTTDVISIVTSHAAQTTTNNNIDTPGTRTRQRSYSISESASGAFFATSRPVNSGLDEVKGVFGRIEVKATGAQDSVKVMAKKHTEERRRRASFSETRKSFNQ